MSSTETVLRLRKELAAAARRAGRSGIQTGNGGNLSCRIPDEDLMLVTKSGGSLPTADEDSFILTDLDGQVVDGAGKPTRETYMHGHLYQMRPELGSVVHVHSPYVIGVTASCDALPRSTWHFRMKMPDRVPVFDVRAAMVRPQDWPQIRDVLAAEPGLSAFVLKEHGSVSLAPTPEAAEMTAELLEETAKVSLLSALAKLIR